MRGMMLVDWLMLAGVTVAISLVSPLSAVTFWVGFGFGFASHKLWRSE